MREHDPRREERRARTRVPLPDDVTPLELDPDVRRSLLTLSRETADLVARHLVMTGRLLDVDPEKALLHARAAGALAGRVADVREAVGIAAYTAGEWAEALSELRAARRMSGSPEHLAVMADCERALGRPERALAVLDDPDVPRLEQATRVELVIVVAGARRDLGQHDAAVLLLQGPARATTARRPWAPRLWYAHAEALLEAGREDQARAWFAKAADVDPEGGTDAAERLLELDGYAFDTDEDDAEPDDDAQDSEPPLDAASLQELVAGVPLLEARPEVAEQPAPTREPEPEPESGPVATVVPSAVSPFSGAPEVAPAPPVRPAAVPTVAFVAADEGAPVDEQDDEDDPRD